MRMKTYKIIRNKLLLFLLILISCGTFTLTVKHDIEIKIDAKSKKVRDSIERAKKDSIENANTEQRRDTTTIYKSLY